MSAEHDGYGVSAETFQEIIRQRKVEKNRRTEEKRVAVLKSIQDRKSKSGNDPLELFPKEVWKMVLDELKEPKDLSNVSEVHGVFDDLLESRNIRDILFPQVVSLPIQIDPRPCRKVLPLARDLNTRAVSKSMRNGIDRWYEDNLLRYLRTEKHVDRGLPTISVDLNDSKVVKRLLGNFVGSGSDEPKAKRFLQRSLGTVLSADYLDDNVEDDGMPTFQKQCAQSRNDICSLLEVIGDQVWHFGYFVGHMDLLERGGVAPLQIYTILVEWAELMPNLKWLQISVGDEWSDAEQGKGVSIESYLVNHPFPTLRNLERLAVELNSRSLVLFEIYQAIISANRHLKSFRIEGYKDEHLELLPTSRIQDLDSLEALSIGWYEYENENCFTWQSIRPVITFQWHLKQIRLKIGLQVGTLMDVFQVLEKFQTLEHVALNIEKVQITGDLKFLALPNLTEFELKFNPVIDFQSGSVVQFFFSLQFLLYCKKLKKLRWGNGTEEDQNLRRFMTNRECQERMINFRAGYRNLSHSNIWDVFPYLDKIVVELVESHARSNIVTFRTIKFKRFERDLPNDKYVRNRPLPKVFAY